MAQAEAEPPECPVCLQPYDDREAVPRVLACGHSVCEQCLLALPPPRPALPDALRCPACTQVVPFQRSRGPAALPKNIELLRFLPSSYASDSNPNRHSKPKSSPPPEAFPLPSTQSRMFSDWKDSILPFRALRIVSASSESELSVAAVTYTLGRPWFLLEEQRVSLLPIVTEADVDCSSEKAQWFHPSYTMRLIGALSKLEEGAKEELKSVVEASLKERRGLCNVYGLWLDEECEKLQLYLVCERFDRSLVEMLKEDKKPNDGLKEDKNVNFSGIVTSEVYGFLTIAMELCEAVMSLHSQGLVCGCLMASCFRFDSLGHCLLDLNEVLMSGRRIWEDVNAFGSRREGNLQVDESVTHLVGVSPEVLFMLHDKDVVKHSGVEGSVGYSSDVWSMSYIFSLLLTGGVSLAMELLEGLPCIPYKGFCENSFEQYEIWKERVVSKLGDLLTGIQLECLLDILTRGLSYNPQDRPQLSEIWGSIRNLLMNSFPDDFFDFDFLAQKKVSPCCLLLGHLCYLPKIAQSISIRQGKRNMTGSSRSENSQLPQEKVVGDEIKAMNDDDFKSITLCGHNDCITGLAIGGGLLFSSSFDKIINIWSLEDFSHLHSLKGHEHKVMAIHFIDDPNQSLCVSGDSGSGIFLWRVGKSTDLEPLKKWYEHNDWRYSGIHSLAVIGGYLYTGSGDKSIKAWSLQDYSLLCTMMGHKSTVSSLAATDGILYSGSWDGTIRLWWLHDHSPLAVLGDDSSRNSVPVLRLSIDNNLLVSSYENGVLKVWKNDVLVRSDQIQNGALFALCMYKNWFFTGGWEKSISVQELSENGLESDIKTIASITCDSIVTCLVYFNGKLLVGLSNKEIKVYSFGC